jgi:hypothetical protein
MGREWSSGEDDGGHPGDEARGGADLGSMMISSPMEKEGGEMPPD